MDSKKQTNKELLQKILMKKPNTQFVWVKRWGTPMEDVVDIPIKGLEVTLKVNPQWEVMVSNKQMDDEVAALFDDESNDLPELEVKEKTILNRLELPTVPPAPTEAEISAAIAAMQEQEGTTIEVAPQTLRTPDFKCPDCDFVGKNAGGLRFHSKKHKKNETA